MEREAVILRPYGVVFEGALEVGVELILEDGVIREIRPHTGIPENFVVSAAFVNAHSHFEYRGMLDSVAGDEYWSWIRELTRLKGEQTPDRVRQDCFLAAQENVRAGIAVVLEHSDRPYSGEAMRRAGLKGAIMQEVITVFEHESAEAKLESVRAKAAQNREAFGGPVFLSPHAYQTVDPETLAKFAHTGPISIHAAETEHENALTRSASGPIAEFFLSHGFSVRKTGLGMIASLAEMGLLRTEAQLVHCCALESGDVDLIAERGASVAHCPRSNLRLQCPIAPIADLLDAGVRVGLGLDSAASSGRIDMFDEMRAALQSSLQIGRPLTGERIWKMATSGGYASIAPAVGGDVGWKIEVDSAVPLIKIHVSGAETVEDLIERGSPSNVERISQKAD